MKTNQTNFILCAMVFASLAISIAADAQTAPLAPKRIEVYTQRPTGRTSMPQSSDFFQAKTQGDTMLHHINLFQSNIIGDSSITHKDTAIFHHASSSLPDVPLEATLYLLLSDSSSNVDYIHVKLGTTEGASNILEKAFNNSPGALNDGTWLSQKGKKIYIGLGEFTGINTAFFAEAYLENAAGNSPLVKYAMK